MSATVRAPFVRLGWVPFLVVVTLTGLGRLVLAVARHPWLAAAVLAVVAVQQLVLEHGAVVLLVPLVLAAALLGWRRLGPRTFEAAVGRTVRSRWRRAWTYRREWQPALAVTGLEGHVGTRPPRLLGVDSTPDGDRVLVRMAPGQTVDEWQAQARKLAAVFGVRHVRARRAPRGRDRIVLHARRHITVDVDPAPEPPVVSSPSPELVVERAPAGAFPRNPGGAR